MMVSGMPSAIFKRAIAWTPAKRMPLENMVLAAAI